MSEDITSDWAGVVCQPSRMASSSIRERKSAGCLGMHKQPAAERGFTLLELIVVIVIFAVMMSSFIDRALIYQEQAEKTAMEGVAGAIQDALVIRRGQMWQRDNLSDFPSMAQDNPMSWLLKIPGNYAGEFYDPTPLTVQSGNWLFDLKSRDLIYVVRNTGHFKPGKDGKNWIRFHIATGEQATRTQAPPGKPARLTGTLFEPVEPYTWF